MEIKTNPTPVPGVLSPSNYGLFRRRLNRFVVELDMTDGATATASMANPGRMQEILLPGARLGLRPGPDGGKHPWRVVSFHRPDLNLPIDTQAANHVAFYLIENGAIPSLSDWRVQRREAPSTDSRSRFDFLLRRRDDATKERYLEVKSCSLFNGEWALFPDAVTERGRRHVEELSATNDGAVLFIAHSQQVRYFAPDMHADLEFARALAAARDKVEIIVAALDWTEQLELTSGVRELEIPWDRIHLGDTGSYLILMELSEATRIVVGGLGALDFDAGFYLYVGSAMKQLSRRMNRHKRGNATKLHWHIDYLRNKARYVDSWAIRDVRRREDDIAETIATISEGSVPGFGSSDRRASSHLFFWREDPRRSEAFQSTILELRRASFEGI